MKKGFTLIELLIVMVVVAVLVSVALPKYYASMERGRSVEGINNLRAVSDAANAQYILNGNSYPSFLFSSNAQNVADITKSQYFGTPQITGSGTELRVTSVRTDGSYHLLAYNSGGELQYIQCVGAADTCLNIGMELSGGKYVMDFTK